MPIVPEMDKFKRDNAPIQDYYKAWDKFAKLAEQDEEEEQAKNPTFKGESPTDLPKS